MAEASRSEGTHPTDPEEEPPGGGGSGGDRAQGEEQHRAHPDGDVEENSDPVPEPTPAMRALRLAEDAVYYVMALVLLVASVVVIVLAVVKFGQVVGETETAMLEVLDALLLVFIFVELLYAVRVTIARHEIAAEPFLLIGVIASIKEIVVLSVEAAGAIGDGPLFEDRVVLIGVLGAVVLGLCLAMLLLRRSQTYPSE